MGHLRRRAPLVRGRVVERLPNGAGTDQVEYSRVGRESAHTMTVFPGFFDTPCNVLSIQDVAAVVKPRPRRHNPPSTFRGTLMNDGSGRRRWRAACTAGALACASVAVAQPIPPIV